MSCTCVLSKNQSGHDDSEDRRRALHGLCKRHRHILKAHQAQNHSGKPGRGRQRWGWTLITQIHSITQLNQTRKPTPGLCKWKLYVGYIYTCMCKDMNAEEQMNVSKQKKKWATSWSQRTALSWWSWGGTRSWTCAGTGNRVQTSSGSRWQWWRASEWHLGAEGGRTKTQEWSFFSFFSCKCELQLASSHCFLISKTCKTQAKQVHPEKLKRDRSRWWGGFNSFH